MRDVTQLCKNCGDSKSNHKSGKCRTKLADTRWDPWKPGEYEELEEAALTKQQKRIETTSQRTCPACGGTKLQKVVAADRLLLNVVEGWRCLNPECDCLSDCHPYEAKQVTTLR